MAAGILALLCGAACASSGAAPAPAPPGAPSEAIAAAGASGLVDLQALDSSIVVEAKYAGSDNFTGAPLPGYLAPRVWLRRDVAEALARVEARFRATPYALKVFDGYRPVRATLAMVAWAERTGREDLLQDGYIARRSRHNLGTAVDLTLIDRATGREADMGTPYDTFSEAAHTANAVGKVLETRLILVRAMEAEGFQSYEKEWWHFSYPVPGAVPLDVPIRRASAP